MERIGVIAASVREGRRGFVYAQWIVELAHKRGDIEAQLIDLRDWPLGPYDHPKPPIVAEAHYEPGSMPHRWRELVLGLDGVIAVTPEYNRSYPGQLKNAFDWLFPAWSHKPAAFVTYGGWAAGARAAEHLALVVTELRMVPIRDQVNIRLMGLATDERHMPSDPGITTKATAMFDELVWWSRALREARSRG